MPETLQMILTGIFGLLLLYGLIMFLGVSETYHAEDDYIIKRLNVWYSVTNVVTKKKHYFKTYGDCLLYINKMKEKGE